MTGTELNWVPSTPIYAKKVNRVYYSQLVKSAQTDMPSRVLLANITKHVQQYNAAVHALNELHKKDSLGSDLPWELDWSA